MKPLYAIVALFILLSACISRQNEPKCGSVICTDIFISITANLIATKGSNIDFKSYKVINLATGKEIKTQSVLPGNSNTLIIADDSQRKNFAEKGEKLQLQVTRKDDKVITADYTIAGGPCSCHVAKLNGPDQVDLDN